MGKRRSGRGGSCGGNLGRSGIIYGGYRANSNLSLPSSPSSS